MRACKRGRCDDPLHRHGRVRECNVVAHRSIEQNVLLQHDAHLPAQPEDVDHGKIDAVDQDAPALRHVQTLDDLGERALTGPDGPTIPTTWPAGTLKLTSCSTSAPSMR